LTLVPAKSVWANQQNRPEPSRSKPHLRENVSCVNTWTPCTPWLPGGLPRSLKLSWIVSLMISGTHRSRLVSACLVSWMTAQNTSDRQPMPQAPSRIQLPPGSGVRVVPRLVARAVPIDVVERPDHRPVHGLSHVGG